MLEVQERTRKDEEAKSRAGQLMSEGPAKASLKGRVEQQTIG